MKVKLPRGLAVFVVAMVVVFYFASFWFHINIWLALAIIVVSILINGLVAVVPRDEDK